MCRLDVAPGRQQGGITSIDASYGIIMGLLWTGLGDDCGFGFG